MPRPRRLAPTEEPLPRRPRADRLAEQERLIDAALDEMPADLQPDKEPLQLEAESEPEPEPERRHSPDVEQSLRAWDELRRSASSELSARVVADALPPLPEKQICITDAMSGGLLMAAGAVLTVLGCSMTLSGLGF